LSRHPKGQRHVVPTAEQRALDLPVVPVAVRGPHAKLLGVAEVEFTAMVEFTSVSPVVQAIG